MLVEVWNLEYLFINWIDILIEYFLYEGKIGMLLNIEMIFRFDGK